MPPDDSTPREPPPTSKARTDDLYEALDRLESRERRFVKAALSGCEYEDAARIAKLRGPLSVVRMLGRPLVRDALQRLAPLLPDARHARRLLEPFALQALAGNLRDSTPAATRTSAAREVLSPASALAPGAQPSRSGSGGPGTADAWARQREQAEARRKAARQAAREEKGAPAGTVPPPEPRVTRVEALTVADVAALPDEQTIVDPDRAAG